MLSPRQELKFSPRIIGRSMHSVRMRNFVDQVASTHHTVLLLGETGTGKDHLAEAIHAQVGRGEFVTVDCGALTETLTESELFGHTRGAFTDAQHPKSGLLQIADGGTIFFNEVGNMSLSLQAKFLRILEKKPFRQVGGTKEFQVNTRIIAATNKDLKQSVKRGELREDLFHRLNVLSFTLPALRDRTEDIPQLAEYFLGQSCEPKSFTDQAVEFMAGYDWPGNVRELKNAVLRGIFHSEDSTIRPEDLRVLENRLEDDPEISENALAASYQIPTWKEHEASYIKHVLKRARGNITRSAKIAGLSPHSFRYLVRKLNLESYASSLRKSPTLT